MLFFTQYLFYCVDLRPFRFIIKKFFQENIFRINNSSCRIVTFLCRSFIFFKYSIFSFVGNTNKFIKDEGATVSATGLAYKVIKEGTGATPGGEDVVEVHYHGTLADGTVFDSSVERGKTISFPLNRVIKGWTEGLQTMKEGGKTKFVIPADLAYGEAGAPPKIPGGATLVFEVELFKVTKAADAAKAAAPAAKPAPKKK